MSGYGVLRGRHEFCIFSSMVRCTWRRWRGMKRWGANGRAALAAPEYVCGVQGLDRRCQN